MQRFVFNVLKQFSISDTFYAFKCCFSSENKIPVYVIHPSAFKAHSKHSLSYD